MSMSATSDRNGPRTATRPVLGGAGGGALRRDRERLAHAVLGRRDQGDPERVREIPRDNSSLGMWMDVESAVTAGIAYAGKVDAQILALDGDQDDNEAAVEAVVTKLYFHGIVGVVEDSGQPGRVHLWARISDPELKKEIATYAAQLGLEPRDWMRPPLAPHRLGLTARLRSPMTADLAEHVLRMRVERALSQHARGLLRHGNAGQYGESALLTITGSAFQNGWTFEKTLAAVETSALASMLERAAGKRGDIRAALLKLWFRSIKYTYEHPAIGDSFDSAMTIAEVRTKALTTPFAGQSGATRRAVLIALLNIAVQANTVVVGASHRQLAEAAGRSERRPVRNAIRWLKAEGFIVVVKESASDTLSNEYRLILTRINMTPAVTSGGHAGGEEGRCSGVFLTHDTFARGGGLGHNAAWIYEALDCTPRTTSELATISALNLQQAGRALTRLTRRELATRVADGWVCGPADVDTVAVRRGSAGSGADQKTKHQRERLFYRGRETRKDGTLRFVVLQDTSTKIEAPKCPATRRDGQPCQAKATKGRSYCRAHRNRRFDLCPQDLDWAAGFEADVSYGYQT